MKKKVFFFWMPQFPSEKFWPLGMAYFWRSENISWNPFNRAHLLISSLWDIKSLKYLFCPFGNISNSSWPLPSKVLCFLRRPQNLTKSSRSIWRYVVSVKSTVKISSILVAYLEKMNFNEQDTDYSMIYLLCFWFFQEVP